MNEQEFNAFCKAMKASTYVVQWGGAHVWKIGGKVFAIGGMGSKGVTNPNIQAVTFKVTPLSYDILKEQPGLRPAPYLASRGMKWIQHYDEAGLSDDDLKAYIERSYRTCGRKIDQKIAR
ncbi:MAG: MmcQ/YjbR family DNA-binding protein [Hyphomicrobiales bacterium]